MKKRILLLGLFLCLMACQPSLHKMPNVSSVEFKNPLFSTPMRAMKPNGAVVQLSPTAMIDLTNQTLDSCELIEDEPTTIFMKCVQNDVSTDYQDFEYFARYTSIGLDDTQTYCLIHENVFKSIKENENTFIGRARFFIPRTRLKKEECGITGTLPDIRPPERF